MKERLDRDGLLSPRVEGVKDPHPHPAPVPDTHPFTPQTVIREGSRNCRGGGDGGENDDEDEVTVAESCPGFALARRFRTRAENLRQPRGLRLPGAWRTALQRALNPSPRARCAPRQERSGAQAAPRSRGPGHGGGLGVPAVSAPPPPAPAYLPPRPHSPAQPPGAPSRTRVASPSDRQKLGELASASRLPDFGTAATAR